MAGPLAAQQTAPQVTDAQVADYKRAALTACKDAGKQRGDPEARVEAFCGCMIETLDKHLTPIDWRRIVLYSLQKREREEVNALSPHLKKLEVCRPKA